MGSSKGVTISVKAPVDWDKMTKRKKQRLRQIVNRDTRIIRSFLGIIEHHESNLLSGLNKTRIDDGALDRLTITTTRVTSKYPQRLSVAHDMKKKYPRCSSSELIECRRTAITLYESYLALKKRKSSKVSRPCESTKSGRIPRWIYSPTFKLLESSSSSISYWWLDLQNSFASAPMKKPVHDRIRFPLRMSKFHINQIERGTVESLQLINNGRGKWWVHFAVRMKEASVYSKSNLPPAIFQETRYIISQDKARAIEKYDRRIAELQSEIDARRSRNQSYNAVAKKLKQLKIKRENVSKDMQ